MLCTVCLREVYESIMQRQPDGTYRCPQCGRVEPAPKWNPK